MGNHGNVLRFVSLDTDSNPGELVTQPFVLEGSQNCLNADACRCEIKVEVQNAGADAEGKPVPGLAAPFCNRVTGDSVRHEVSWRSKTELSSLKGRTVRVRFQMQNTRLYSFEVAP